MAYGDVEDALARADDTRFGLNGSVCGVERGSGTGRGARHPTGLRCVLGQPPTPRSCTPSAEGHRTKPRFARAECACRLNRAASNTSHGKPRI
ncbi:hypothetical protein [Streptomyces sp. NBC_00075]|uniref:hypothetical protein n=1 Tax=Streptomyces sp. NBC_00075 TaxID=2975641 RepID=UPI00386FB856